LPLLALGPSADADAAPNATARVAAAANIMVFITDIPQIIATGPVSIGRPTHKIQVGLLLFSDGSATPGNRQSIVIGALSGVANNPGLPEV
jgi:hypothetical protein